MKSIFLKIKNIPFNFRESSLFGLIIIFLLPMAIYLIARWDPVIGNEDNPFPIGMWTIIITYWIGLFLIWKRNEKINDLIKKVEEKKHTIGEIIKKLETAQKRLKTYKKGENISIRGIVNSANQLYESNIDDNDLRGSLKKIGAFIDHIENPPLEKLDVKAEILARMEKYDVAKILYWEIIGRDENYVNAYIRLANIYLDDEMKNLEKEIENKPLI